MALSGNVYFPGVQVATAADFTLSHGISPSVCLLQTVPQTSYVAEIGTLQLSFGSTLLSFPDCAVRSATLRSSEQGLFWSLQILDRRWKWQFGEIDGRYNVRSADGSIIDSTEKTPRQLAELLLRAMNESQFDVDQIPNDSRPTVVWDAANPADELAQLCDQLSCRIVLGLDNHVRIRPIGDGQTLPEMGLEMNAAFGLQAQTRPDSLKLVGGPTLFQSRLSLEAVGEDTDGKIKPIDQLSYRPDQGWQGQVPSVLADVAEADRSLALKSVFRWYRITSQVDGKMIAPGDLTIEHIQQLLPLIPTRLETERDDDGREHHHAATVGGVFWLGGEKGENGSQERLYTGRWSLDTTLGVVRFAEPVTKLSSEGFHRPAEMWLETSYNVTDVASLNKIRFQRSRQLAVGENQTGSRILHVPAIVRTVWQKFDSAGQTAQLFDNLTDVEQAADEHLLAVSAEYELEASNDVQYAGLIPIEPDGAIQQVTWRVGNGQPATTRASRNAEFNIYVPTYADRRQRERNASQQRRF